MTAVSGSYRLMIVTVIVTVSTILVWLNSRINWANKCFSCFTSGFLAKMRVRLLISWLVILSVNVLMTLSSSEGLAILRECVGKPEPKIYSCRYFQRLSQAKCRPLYTYGIQQHRRITLYLIEKPLLRFGKHSRPKSGSSCKSCLIRVYSVCLWK